MSSYVPGYVPNPLVLPFPVRTLTYPDKVCQAGLLSTLSGLVIPCQGLGRRGRGPMSAPRFAPLPGSVSGDLSGLGAEPGEQ